MTGFILTTVAWTLVLNAEWVLTQELQQEVNQVVLDWFAADYGNTSKIAMNISCEASEMVVSIFFSDPFSGKVMLENDLNTKGCWQNGNGTQDVLFRIPLYGCGTKREPPSTFKNKLIILFDQSQVLELGDQRKIILCSYPVPRAPAFLEVHRNHITGLSSSAQSLSGNTSGIGSLSQTMVLLILSLVVMGWLKR